jgi:hypothetical protein
MTRVPEKQITHLASKEIPVFSGSQNLHAVTTKDTF